ncbi:hypothetical protein MSUIS_04920 [Mycoplasma suis KI3806]|uniref:Uncharacterized protein n=1 Tax=Mycoplasma suis (strain KI_3806) TaxID=708248 RepID=F0V1Q4_MYCS3|nr:hypothetical protein [Mycoplasma suis]CBZ40585.1 hypothetical protein MSUIS_04920 [Mycoplasma suis KI3806]
MPKTVSIGINKEKERLNKEKRNSLKDFWFNEWAYKSEGASNPIYLVNSSGLIKELAPSLHGQKQRFMWDGVSIDKLNSWFGSRAIPFSEENILGQKTSEEIRLLDIWKKLRNSFLSQSASEFKSLSKWFEELPDSEKCGIIDSLVDCYDFKDAIGQSEENSSINDGFKIDLSKLIDLAGKVEKDQFPKFTDLFSKNGAFYIGAFKGFEEKVGKILDIWIQEEIKKESFPALKVEETEQKLNGMKLLKVLFSDRKFGEGCDKYLKNNEEKEIFFECAIEKSDNFMDDPEKEGERFLNPKVLDVIKAGNLEEKMKKPSYVPSLFKKILEPKDREWREFSGDKREQIKNDFKTKGKWKGVLDISCSNVEGSDIITSLWSIFSDSFPERMGCREFFQLLFSGDQITDKRLCLFELPNVKSYIKETNLFGPFMMSNWNQGNKMWMKCSAHSL